MGLVKECLGILRMKLQYNNIVNKISELEFTNRELSWLGFNQRVLELASSSNVPLGEKLKFSAIFASNLDEFFMVRIGSLFDQTLLDNQPTENKTGLTPNEQLTLIMPKVSSLLQVRDRIIEQLYQDLEANELYHVDFENMPLNQLSFWRNYFLSEIEPLMSPQIIDKRHPFPFLRNLESYVIAIIKTKGAEKFRVGLIPISTQLPKIVSVKIEEKTWYAFTEELILLFADLAFGGMGVREKSLFRVTRNADLSMAESMLEHDIDYRLVMSELLKKRRKLAAVRLELSHNAHDDIVNYLLQKLELSPLHVFNLKLPLQMNGFYDLSKLLRQKSGNTQHFYPYQKPRIPEKGYSLFEATKENSVLACYPFHSMRPFIAMLNDAATSPDVISIKMTLYRLADDSKIIDALTIAAEQGKEVVAVVELRARFDEQNNIDLSNKLEDAGCTIFYGFENYKVHSKLCLITSVKDDKHYYISAIGTGNFNETTAELYTDISYITRDEDVGTEIATLFHDLSLGRTNTIPRKMLIAPNYFKTEIIRQIDFEIENHKNNLPSAITLKFNSLSDRDVIDKLYAASNCGVKIELIVRGICCLRAGIPNLSENITVRSIVGRYLEHSRIYSFGVGETARCYIASGDLLTRNTERRIEAGVQVIDERSKTLLLKILDYQLMDNCNCWILQPDGSYTRITVGEGEELFDSHTKLHELLNKYDNGYNMQKQAPQQTSWVKKMLQFLFSKK